MEEKKETQIDFVIAWVDGGDPAWQRERDRYGKMGEKTAVEETGEREVRRCLRYQGCALP